MEDFITRFNFKSYDPKREQNKNKIKNLVTGSNKLAKLVKDRPKYRE